MSGFKRLYSISNLGISLYTPWQENVSKEFEEFVNEEVQGSYQVRFVSRDRLPKIHGKKLFENLWFSVYLDEQNNWVRRFHDYQKDYKEYASMSLSEDGQSVLVEYVLGEERYFGDSKKDFFHIGWERLLIYKDRFILHSACVSTKFGGVLFSGPSGIGKTTQAKLWCDYKFAKQINGDRPILQRTETGWRAHGSPYAGSSECYVNQSCEINAIVMLKQSSKCSLRRMDHREAFRKIYEQLIVNTWDKEYVSKVCDLAIGLAAEVPIYELTCTPSLEAVEILEKELEREHGE